MGYLKKPFAFGKITLPNNVFYSPLAGCSDFPFRRMSARYAPGLMYCEMVKMEALVRNDPNTYHLLDYDTSMHPIGGQLVGGNPKLAGPAAKILEDLGFDVVDLNCGCPVSKVTKDGGGSGLLLEPGRIGDMIANMVAAVDVPVTVKVRSGWDEDSLNAPEIVRLAESAGATAIAVHGRTRKQAYRGQADRSLIAACKEAAGDILVIGNGDIFDPESALDMFESSGCDAILCSRGTMGGPWLAHDICQYLEGGPLASRSTQECRQALIDHFDEMLAYLPEHKALIEMRRVGCWYIKRTSGTRDFRAAIAKAGSLAEVRHLISVYEMGGVEEKNKGAAAEALSA
jgi:tRNA-dihydrouridine synthase B